LPTLRSATRTIGVAAILTGALAVVLAPAGSTPTPPIAKGFRILEPGATLHDGETLQFYSFWDSTHYAVTADLSELDPTATQPVAGTYIGDLPIGAAGPAWPCYWFSHTLPAVTPRADGAGIEVPVTATHTHTGASTTNSAVRFCLSNQPPAHVRTRILGDVERFVVRQGDSLYTVRNGDSLQIETTWRFHLTPFSTLADFSALDDSFAPQRVFYGLVAAPAETLQTHGIYYELSRHAQGTGTATLPIRIQGTDGGCGRDSVTLWVEMDNQPPDGQPVFHHLPTQVMQPSLPVTGRTPAGSHDVLLVLNHATETVLTPIPVGDSLIFTGTIQLAPGTNYLVAYGRDVVGNRSQPSAAHTIELQPTPQFKRWVLLAPDSATSEGTRQVHVQTGDLILLRTYWDSRARYDVWADFRPLDTSLASPLPGVPCENLTVPVGDSLETWYGYQFEHTISTANTRADASDILLPVTAREAVSGFETTSEALRVCLSNHPPQHLWTRVVGDSARWVVRDSDSLYVVRNGSTIYLQTSWRSPNRPLLLRADFARADKDFLDWYVERWLIDSLSTTTVATYGISYPFSTEACCRAGQSAYPLPVRITVTDSGCGHDSVTVLLEMDNQGPEDPPVLEPAPPGDTIAETVPISGRAPEGSYDLLAEVHHVDADSTTSVVLPLDETLHFAGRVPLLPGTNRIVAYGRDRVGNLSSASAAFEVERVTEERVLEIPKPFLPGDRFLLENRRGWARLSAEIYNLEGDRIRAWDQQGAPLLYHVSLIWDGRNGRNAAVSPGPYLLRLHSTDAAGRTQEEVKAFVFQR